MENCYCKQTQNTIVEDTQSESIKYQLSTVEYRPIKLLVYNSSYLFIYLFIYFAPKVLNCLGLKY